MGKAQLKHGDARRNNVKRLYRIWANMLGRCGNPNKPDYKYYGEKGISVCNDWKDYSIFKEWAHKNGYTEALTLDRIDGSKDYCPENCRWISIQEQQSNKKSNHLLTFNNETHTINEWSRILGIHRELIKDRLLAGWSVERTLTEPTHSVTTDITFNGETHNWTEWAKITGISRRILYSRYNDMHWSVEDTLTRPVKKKNRQH